jgi:hypothetical protein
MTLLQKLLLQAARRVAADPNVQAKAGKIYRDQIKPAAKEAWRNAEPALRAAHEQLKEDLGPTADKVAKTKKTVMDRLTKPRAED